MYMSVGLFRGRLGCVRGAYWCWRMGRGQPIGKGSLGCDDWSVLGCYLGAGAVCVPLDRNYSTVLEYSITYGRGPPLGLNAKR